MSIGEEGSSNVAKGSERVFLACGVLGTKGTFSESLTQLPLPLPPEMPFVLVLLVLLVKIVLLLLLLVLALILLVLLFVLILLVLVVGLVLALALVFWPPDELEPPALLEALLAVLAFVSAVFFLVDPRRLYVDFGCGRGADEEAEETSSGVLSVASSAFFLPLPPTGTFPNSLVLPAGPPFVVAPDVFVDEDPGGPILRALVAVSLRRMAPPVVPALVWVFVVAVVLLLLLLSLLLSLVVLEVEGAL